MNGPIPKLTKNPNALLNHTDKIKKSIFIVQGRNDPCVPDSEAIQMKERIQQGGGTVWSLMAKDERHGFRKKDKVLRHHRLHPGVPAEVRSDGERTAVCYCSSNHASASDSVMKKAQGTGLVK